MAKRSRNKDHPKASAWDKVSGQEINETTANRDVFEAQQLDRSRIEGKLGKGSRVVVALVVAVIVAGLMWAVASLGQWAVTGASTMLNGATGSSGVTYVERVQISATRYNFCILPEEGAIGVGDRAAETAYVTNAAGAVIPGEWCFKNQKDANAQPKPAWVADAEAKDAAEKEAAIASGDYRENTIPNVMTDPVPWKLILVLLTGLLTYGLMYPVLMRNLAAQNLMHDTTDINQYAGDQHIALPDEVVRKFDWFPDVGAHSAVQVSSMISHVMLTNKGLKKIEVAKRADKDILDEDGDVVYLKGEVLRDDDDNAYMVSQPMIDEAFGDDLFEASGLPKDKKIRRRFVASEIEYNGDGKDRDKNGQHKTVADMINADWTYPEYEVQRPAGAYIVDTAPVNTMVLAITRAGKGQTYIEPVIDMWLREKRPSNMVINDPKGELLVKHYVRATMRGYQVTQFNLINAMKTDIYNPLGMAADAAREGDATKCALYVENIADVFFPVDGGEDPVWPNAANNAFKRAAYGLIDYYLEEERELRAYASRVGMDPKVLETRLDEMWGKVTLYNCYQLFVQLTSKKLKNPVKKVEEEAKGGKYGDIDDVDSFDEVRYEADRQAAQAQAFLWDGNPEADLLTLFFNATQSLPQNSMRTLVSNADNALRAMGAAERMLASVYGIAITAMSFFTDPTISTLTSGTPSQNTDLGGLSFPRRMGVRFGMNYLKRDHLIGSQVKWDAFEDGTFQTPLGADFEHEDTVSREGWARYYFIGKFATDTAYLRLRILHPRTGMLIRTFYFRFTKDYQTSLNGRHYVTDPITGEKIVKNGLLVELVPSTGPVLDEHGVQHVDDVALLDAEGKEIVHPTTKKAMTQQVPRVGTVYAPGFVTYPQMRLVDITSGYARKEKSSAHAIISSMVRYSEAPKAVFLVTPPHLMKYAKLILILIKQLVDLNFDKSYMTKADQKPLYKTRFMLDELGNLQSDGHGIAGFETMLSIGLGQEQQFTLILQTLQQLRDVYGESVDKIVQGNPQPLDARIATPSGWLRMGDVTVGTKVLTPFGTMSEITAVYPKGVQPVYRVTLRDGSSAEASAGHIWAIERWKSSFRRVDGALVGTGPDGKTAERFADQMTTEMIKALIEKGQKIDLPRVSPLEYDEARLPVDPYVLGVILGDGHVQSNGVVKFTCNDPETIDEIRRRGYAVVDDTVRGERKDGIGYRINGVNASMRDLGIAGKRSWEKSIPEAYLFGSVQQRVDLLRGLMDTDGTISATGEMEFTSSSRELAEGVQTLVRSLGGRVAINVKDKVMFTSPNQVGPKAGRPAYRVQNVRLPEINPFLLPRKAERWKDRTRGFNRIVSVEYVRDDEVQCISIADERHLYITDDFIPTHNTSNIVFLKSTDDSMLDTLQKMSGTRHTVYRDSKTVTKDMSEIIKMGNVEAKVSYTMSAKEEPVISYNDMAYISERNSIVFRAGDSPVWNRNETILPMSWRLFRDTIVHPGHDYSLQTIPTLSSALDFDVRNNQPDFTKMLTKRMKQAEFSELAKNAYQEAFGYTDVDVDRLDPDVYSDEVMELVDESVRESASGLSHMPTEEMSPQDIEGLGLYSSDPYGDFIENTEVAAAAAAAATVRDQRVQKIYAEGQISREDLADNDGTGKTGVFDYELVTAYKALYSDLRSDYENFTGAPDGSLRSRDGQTVYISKEDETDSLTSLNQAAQQGGTRVYAEELIDQVGSYTVHREFYAYLASLPTWQGIARGEFDQIMAKLIQEK